MAKTTICAPNPADKALKALVGLLEIGDVEFMLDPACKITVEEVHPMTDSTITKTILGWPSCVKHLSQHTILWDSENALQEEAWIQEAATALLGGK